MPELSKRAPIDQRQNVGTRAYHLARSIYICWNWTMHLSHGNVMSALTHCKPLSNNAGEEDSLHRCQAGVPIDPSRPEPNAVHSWLRPKLIAAVTARCDARPGCASCSSLRVLPLCMDSAAGSCVRASIAGQCSLLPLLCVAAITTVPERLANLGRLFFLHS